MLTVSLPAFAEHFEGQPDWTVKFTTADKLESNFKSSDIVDFLKELQPGDDATFTIRLVNDSKKTINWYFLNQILQSLEDSQASAAGGAYSYLLVYQPSDGAAVTIYDSKTVGGELKESEPEGLHGVDSALKDYIALGTMKPGKAGVVTLTVSLDGETQGNGYQNTMADLRMRFAVEIVPDHKIIKTGDESIKLAPYYIVMAASGLLFLVLAIDGLRQRKKQGGESK